MTARSALVLGGGDVGSAVACGLFARGVQVLICERPRSAHSRRGMAYIDALFDGSARLNGTEARAVPDLPAVRACWAAAEVIPIVTLPEDEVLKELVFDIVVDATMRRNRVPPDLRGSAGLAVGLGPGFVPGENCHIAIETQWGACLGDVLLDRPALQRSGGPKALDGVGRERFVAAPHSGLWHTTAQLGQPVRAGDPVGQVGATVLRAPIDGHLRGLAHDGVEVPEGRYIVEVDPRSEPQVFGLGERPQLIASGVLAALGWRHDAESGPARG